MVANSSGSSRKCTGFSPGRLFRFARFQSFDVWHLLSVLSFNLALNNMVFVYRNINLFPAIRTLRSRGPDEKILLRQGKLLPATPTAFVMSMIVASSGRKI